MTPSHPHVIRRNPKQRRTLRLTGAALAAGAAALYVVVFFVQLPHLHETDNPAPAYIALALVYAAGATLLAIRDDPLAQWAGAAVQAILIVAFFWLLALLYREGDQQFILDMAFLAVTITAIQFVLLGLLLRLAAGSRRPAH